MCCRGQITASDVSEGAASTSAKNRETLRANPGPFISTSSGQTASLEGGNTGLHEREQFSCRLTVC
jgi:hypothetical protein